MLRFGIGILAATVISGVVHAETVTRHLIFAGVDRTYIVHTPTDYNVANQYPLLLSFHGHYGTGAKEESKTGFDSIADSQGFITAYPDSNPNYGDGTEWQITGAVASNDIGFVGAMVKDIKGAYSVDPTREYATGFSEGGDLVWGVVCTYSNKIAGFATVANDLLRHLWKVCKSQSLSPITALFFHGTADPISPYNGDRRSYSAMDTATTWATSNGCKRTKTTTKIPDLLSDGSSVVDTDYTFAKGCDAGDTVDLYAITNGGHTWPGTSTTSASILGPVSLKVLASQIIWDTLSQHSSP